LNRLRRRERLAAARLYLCTDGRRRQGDLPDFLDAVLRGGVDVVQLREKGLEAQDEIDLCEVFAAAARRHGALFAVNDRADIAAAVRPDVLHLGQRDLPVEVARELVGTDVLIGRSTHSATEVDEAVVATNIDYFCVGPVWPTPTKPGRPAPGLSLLRHAAAARSVLPWFAIGGIGPETVDQVTGAGARRIVVVRALTEADDPEAAARQLVARLVG
jgi:thiamine-phosphate pyrophosphorylase